jgi:hypothetical protein
VKRIEPENESWGFGLYGRAFEDKFLEEEKKKKIVGPDAYKDLA